MDNEKLRRSMLYLSGSYPAMLARVRYFPADMFCFDVEDGVSPGDKSAARDRIADTVRNTDFAGRERIIRVNGLDTPWGYDDIAAAATLPIDGILLPKVEGGASVRQAVKILEEAHAPDNFAVWCLIETPLGVLRAEEIAASSRRLAGLVIGGNDLAETTGSRDTPERLPQLMALSLCILAARAHRIAVIDAVHPDYTDHSGFPESCRRAVELGFDGKSIAVPETIAAANVAFGPTPADIERAQSRIDAARAVGGNAYEDLRLASDRRLLARAACIAAREAELSSPE